METEHCRRDGHNREFSTTNYKLTTRPSVEWTLVVKREGKSDAEFEAVLASEGLSVGLGEGFHGRRIPDVLAMMKLEAAAFAKLTRQEVIAVILYTGPMVIFLSL